MIVTKQRIRREAKRWTIDFLSSAIFASVMDFMTAAIAHIQYFPTIFIFSMTSIVFFRWWSGRIYGLWLNWFRGQFGEGKQ